MIKNSAFIIKTKENLKVLIYALKDKRTPLLSKLLILVTISYALSPIDLIPDFIPLLGMLDDLLIVPLGVFLAIKLIPPTLFQELKDEALLKETDIPEFLKRFGLIAVFLTWLFLLLIVFTFIRVGD